MIATGTNVRVSRGPFGYLTDRVGIVRGPQLIARAYDVGWDDLGVVCVDFGHIEGYGDVTYSTHWSNLAVVAK